MNIAYELLIIAALIVATLAVAQGLESGAISLGHLEQIAAAH